MVSGGRKWAPATIRDALARHGGNRTHAAADLGISRNTLWRKMKRYSIQ